MNDTGGFVADYMSDFVVDDIGGFGADFTCIDTTRKTISRMFKAFTDGLMAESVQVSM